MSYHFFPLNSTMGSQVLSLPLLCPFQSVFHSKAGELFLNRKTWLCHSSDLNSPGLPMIFGIKGLRGLCDLTAGFPLTLPSVHLSPTWSPPLVTGDCTGPNLA